MSLTKQLVLGTLTAVAMAAAIYGAIQFRVARGTEEEANAVRRRTAETSARVAALESQVEAEVRRAAATEGDNATLDTAVAKARTVLTRVARTLPVRTAEQVSRETVEARYRRASELAREGDPAEALRELLWCYDVGMVSQSSYNGVRSSSLLSEIKRLGERHPPALAALRDRRDRAHRRILAGGDAEIPDFVALNRTLEEERLTLEVFDQVPAGGRQKQVLAIYSSNLLVAERRYAEALLGSPYHSMSARFERDINEHPDSREDPGAERLGASQRTRTITATAEDIEVLAGAGQLDNARNLAERLLAYDNTPATRALIQQHAERAGQPHLLPR